MPINWLIIGLLRRFLGDRAVMKLIIGFWAMLAITFAWTWVTNL